LNQELEMAKVIPLALPAPPEGARARRPRSAVARVALVCAGWALLAAGACLLFLPGPGVPLLLGGLALIAEEQDWARRLLGRLKDRLQRFGSIWKQRRAA
jgi:hypothetical protein